MNEDDELYKDREQTLVKHIILREYLERFAHIVGFGFDTITYVDCFAGPWKERSENLEDTSFYIAIQKLKRAKQTHKDIRGKIVNIRCFFIEPEPEPYSRLLEFAATQSDITIETFNGVLADAIPRILTFVRGGGTNNIPFFFIDPTGWTGFGMDMIAPLLRQDPGEVLINFMTSFIRRFAEIPAEARNMELLYGEPSIADKVKGLETEERDDILVKQYCRKLAEIGNFKFTFPAIILEPLESRPHFHMVYCTRNDKGIEVFKSTEEKAMEAMEKERAKAYKRKAESKGQQFMFGQDETPPSSYYSKLRDRYLNFARMSLEESLMARGTMTYDEAWLETMKYPLTWENDLREILNQMKSNGYLTFDGQIKRLPKRGVGLKLVWTGSRR